MTAERRLLSRRLLLASAIALAMVGTAAWLRCESERGAPESRAGGGTDAEPDAQAQQPLPEVVLRDRTERFFTRDHMIAGLEMQISGEPLAEALGRKLAGYDRNARTPRLYQPPGAKQAERDSLGYALAVESYEYSKYAMNAVAFESGPGLSLAFGPLTGAGRTGRAAHDRLRELVQQLAIASHAGTRAEREVGAMRLHDGFVAVPAPEDNPLNTLGFGGLWPVFQPFRSFGLTIRPSGNATRGCSLEGGYGASAGQQVSVGDYECGYATLHLASPYGQVQPVLHLGSSGWYAWKLALWIADYLRFLHDTDGNTIVEVPEDALARVGHEGNEVRGIREDGTEGAAGTWLGPNDLEGFQAGLMIQSLHDQGAHLLRALATRDGRALTGFESVRDALAYDYEAPLTWWPGAVGVTLVRDREAGFPRAESPEIETATPTLLDLLGVIGGYAELYALTDHDNPDLGGSQTARAWLDGDPFAEDDQKPDGDDTAHDRWLAVLKVALVNLDRMFVGDADVLSSTARVTESGPEAGFALTVLDAAYAVVALRQARRALSGNLVVYADATPDTAVTRTALDGTRWRGAPGGASLAERLTRLLDVHAALLLDELTDARGHVHARRVRGADAGAGEAELEGYAAAVRGLLEAHLATGDVRHRRRAERVFERMRDLFYDDGARLWRSTRDGGVSTWTPRRFGVLQAALRELLKLVGLRPGRRDLQARVEAHLARLHELVVDGWNDVDRDGEVDWPRECVHVEGGLPRGGLQMAERALTGELGTRDGKPAADRDRDCVPEIDDVMLPAVMASEVSLDAP